MAARTKKNLSIELHHRASDAYDFFHSQSFLFDKTKMSSETLSSLQNGQFFSVVHQLDDTALLFSGFEILGFSINQFDMSEHNIIAHDDLNDSEIEIAAWTGVIRTLLSSIQDSQLEIFRKSFNESAPESIIKKLFSAKKLTQNKLAKYTSLSVSGLKKQNNSANYELSEIEQNNVQSDIFEKLINEANRN